MGAHVRGALGALVLLTLSSLWGCGAAQGAKPALLELERLSFVAAGSCEPFVGLRCVAAEALLVDRFEVTRGLWSHWAGEANLADLEGWGPLALGEHLPAVGMQHTEAAAFARARGMRLPTVAEWVYISAGSRAQSWPYGNTRQFSMANTAELGLGRVAAVGTFPGGSSTGTGVHDLIGNVWEWCAPPLPVGVQPSSWQLQGGSPHPLWAMGGSFQTRASELHSLQGTRRFNAVGLEPGHRATDLGLRCVVPAREYLLRGAERWSDPVLRVRMVQVGHRWGRRSLPLLQLLAREATASDCLRWLLEGAQQ